MARTPSSRRPCCARPCPPRSRPCGTTLTGEKPPGTWERADFPEYDAGNGPPDGVIVRERSALHASLAVPAGHDLAALGDLTHRQPGVVGERPAAKPPGNPWAKAPGPGAGGSTAEPPF